MRELNHFPTPPENARPSRSRSFSKRLTSSNRAKVAFWASRWTQQVAFRLIGVGLIAFLLRRLPAPLEASPARVDVRGKIVSIANDQSSLTIVPAATPEQTWRVGDEPALRARVKQLHEGDRISATGNVASHEMTQILLQSFSIPVQTRIVVLLGVAATIVLVAGLVPHGSRWLIVGADNRYSNSKVQMALWFWLLITVYVAANLFRISAGNADYAGGIEIPTNLIWLSGISAFTFVGARQIVASRIDSSPARASILKPSSPIGPKLRDLVTDDSGERTDFGDFQMLVLTIVAVSVYATRAYGWFATMPLAATVRLPDVDTTILGTFGVAQGAYPMKKFAGDTGKTAAPPPISTDSPPKPPLLPLQRIPNNP